MLVHNTTPQLFSETELHELYKWVDEVPFSRPKRNIARDFADGVLMAELMRHYIPKLVQLHNYSSANGYRQKAYNWETLNQKVFKKIGMAVIPNDIDRVVNGESGAIERILKLARQKIAVNHDWMSTKRSHASSSRCVSQASEQTTSKGGPSRIQTPSQSGRELGNLENLTTLCGVENQPSSQSLIIEELRETNKLLQAKISKMEQLLRLKDAKIDTLMGMQKEEAEKRARAV